MTIYADCGNLSPKTMIELWELDARDIGAQIYRWHAGTTITNGTVVWRGENYTPYPIEAQGFDMNSSGTLPRPTLKISNVGGKLGAVLRQYHDGLGAVVIRRRTLAKYLDAVNFPGGNPDADPSAALPDEIWYVARKASANPMYVEIELAVPFDVENIMLPRRQVLATVCPWKYRGPECGYNGPPVEDQFGRPTNDFNKDVCAKTLRACKARFGTVVDLPYGAFPASLIVRR